MNVYAKPPALLAAAAALLLSACSVLGSSQRDPVTIYAPQVDVRTDPAWPRVEWQLAVVKPTAARLVDSPRIAVRPVPGEIQVYKGASWSQPPTDLIESMLLQAFEDSGKIPSVARSGSGIRADYRLILDLRRFEADYAGQALPSAVIELNAKLLHVTQQRVVASRTFLGSRPAGGVDVSQVAPAFDLALAEIGRDIVAWTLASGQGDHAKSK